jgi:hypothetical protein
MKMSKDFRMNHMLIYYVTVSHEFFSFSTGEKLWNIEEPGVKEILLEQQYKSELYVIKMREELQKPRAKTYEVKKQTFLESPFYEGRLSPLEQRKIDDILKIMEQMVIMINIDKELSELEKIISSREYHGVSTYPEEIQKLLNIRRRLYLLPESPMKSSLLDKSIEILYNYLSKGGILEREDLKEFIMSVPMDKDISVILPSLGYSEEIVKKMREIMDKDINKLPSELRIKSKNEALLLFLLFDLARKSR